MIVAPLHSHVPAAAAGVKALVPEARIVYIMTDTAALPFAFSTLAAQLKEAGLLEASITVGQAFGADYGAVTLYSGLLAARGVLGADVVIGRAGAGECGDGDGVGVRVHCTGGADQRGDGAWAACPSRCRGLVLLTNGPRHQGVSRQTLVALGRVALTQTVVSVPDMPQEKLESRAAAVGRGGNLRQARGAGGAGRAGGGTAETARDRGEDDGAWAGGGSRILPRRGSRGRNCGGAVGAPGPEAEAADE